VLVKRKNVRLPPLPRRRLRDSVRRNEGDKRKRRYDESVNIW